MSRSRPSTDTSENADTDGFDEIVGDVSRMTLSPPTYPDSISTVESLVADDQAWESYWIPLFAHCNIMVVSGCGEVDERVAGRIYATAAAAEAWSAASLQPTAHIDITDSHVESLVVYLRTGWIGKQAFQAILQVEALSRLRVATIDFQTVLASSTPGYRFHPWYPEEAQDFVVWYRAMREDVQDILEVALDDQEQQENESSVSLMDVDEDRSFEDADADT